MERFHLESYKIVRVYFKYQIQPLEGTCIRWDMGTAGQEGRVSSHGRTYESAYNLLVKLRGYSKARVAQ